MQTGQEVERQLRSQLCPEFGQLRYQYDLILELLNAGEGCSQERWEAAAPHLKRIHEEGMEYGCSFDPHPTVRIAVERN